MYSLTSLTKYFLKLGYSGFGGAVALVGYMHRDLVEERKWISEDDYKEGLAFAQLAPGPLAAQLSIYLGYIHYGVLGATLAIARWEEDYHLFILGVISFSAAFIGRLWLRRKWNKWSLYHITGMGISYIFLLIAFYVDNGRFLPLWKNLNPIIYW